MLPLENSHFFCPVKINAGKKALDHLPFELDSLGAATPFLMTSREAAQKGLVKKVIHAFKGSGMPLAIFEETGPVSTLQTVLTAAKLFKDAGCDAILALGSNPVMDMAKALNLCVSQNTEDLESFRTEKDLDQPMKPFLSIPCFSGDGRESGPHAVVGNKILSSRKLMPDAVALDPALIRLEKPVKFAASAMRAMTCAMESTIENSANPLTEAFAQVAVASIFANLLKAMRKEDWKNARHVLLMAETISECAFCNAAPGLAYTLGMEIGRHCMVPSGLCMGIVLPHVLDYLSASEGDGVSRLLVPLGGRDLYAITAERLRSSRVVSMMRDLCFDVYQAGRGEIPGALEGTGLSREKLKDIAQNVQKESDGKFTPEGSLMILEHAWDGSLME